MVQRKKDDMKKQRKQKMQILMGNTEMQEEMRFEGLDKEKTESLVEMM